MLSQGKCSGLLLHDVQYVEVVSFAILFFFKSCISSSHFRWSHRYAEKKEKNKSQKAEHDIQYKKNDFICCLYDGFMSSSPKQSLFSKNKKGPDLHLGLENTHCSLGHIQPQIDQVSQSRHLKDKH